jgi:predicted permease
MNTLRGFWKRILGVFNNRHRDADLAAELDSHLQFHIDDNLRAGMSPEEARRQALIKLGGLDQTKESYRDRRGLPSLDSLLQDIRFALRMLRKSPGFAFVAILTLAVGIGANAAVFGLVDAALLHSLPFRESKQLVYIWTTDTSADVRTPSPAQYLALQKYSRSFESIAGVGWGGNFYTGQPLGESLRGIAASASLLPTLGIDPVLGRNFSDDEQTPGRDAVVILSYDYWRTHFRADRNVIGSKMILNRRPTTIVGVLPQSLGAYYGRIDIFVPLVVETYSTEASLGANGQARIEIVARIKPNISLAQARSETSAIAEGLRGGNSPADRSGRFQIDTLMESLQHPGPTMQNAQLGLKMMAGASLLVLLISCVNVATLLVARGIKRKREVAVRTALGCSRWRLIQQLLTECALLFLCGGAVGLFGARWSEDIIASAVSGIVSTPLYLNVNATVVAVGLAVSLMSALLFGLIPALSASGENLIGSLKDATAKSTAGGRNRRLQSFLVMAQIALGMVLLVSFGLLFRSLLHVESASLGFDPRNVLTSTVTLPLSRYPDPRSREILISAAIDRLGSMPGVESVGATDSLPMDGADSAQMRLETTSSATSIEQETWFLSVSPSYFSTLKIPMLMGRPFQETDRQGSSKVAIVNRTFAETYFPGTTAIGHHVAFADSPQDLQEIVGVVSDFRQRNPEEDARPLVYLPIDQTLPGHWSLVARIRSSSEVGSITSRFADWLQPVDPQLYWQVGSLRLNIQNSESLTLRRPILNLVASFGALALMLVIIGVFGVASYSVAERTREIGIRVALGASRARIAMLVLGESLLVTLAGLIVGGLCALGLMRFFPTGPIGWSGSGIFLFGVSRTDTITYTLAAMVLVIVVLSASWLPARRATRVDPVTAMRCE